MYIIHQILQIVQKVIKKSIKTLFNSLTKKLCIFFRNGDVLENLRPRNFQNGMKIIPKW